MGKRYSNLDIMRIIAALMVFMVHACIHSGFQYNVGAKGVTAFFILSGFLGCLSFEKYNNYKEYYISRIKRILPAYYVALFLLWIKEFIAYVPNIGIKETLTGVCGIKFVRYFLCIQTVFLSDDWMLWNNRVGLWTMSAFVVFYLLVPCIMRVFNSFWKVTILWGGSVKCSLGK